MPSQTAGTNCLAIHSPDVRSVMEFCLREIRPSGQFEYTWHRKADHISIRPLHLHA
jgi:hypothetical protein